MIKAKMIFLGVIVPTLVFGAFANPRPVILPACEEEDGSTQIVCLWDAHEHGNGRGDSYVAIGHGAAFVKINL